jgi:fatty-acyl-CoA synthase
MRDGTIEFGMAIRPEEGRRQLWRTPLLQSPDQEIVYCEPIPLPTANSDSASDDSHPPWTSSAIAPATRSAFSTGDSHRFLKAYFIPMMGTVPQTINVRLSPEQTAYPINHEGETNTLIVGNATTGLSAFV